MPNTRSDGARITNAAMATVTIDASAAMRAASVARARMVDHGGEYQNGARHRPAAHIADVGRHAELARESVQRQQTGRLCEAEQRESREKTGPAGGDECRRPQ